MQHFHLAPRRCLYHWFGWFFFINAGIASLTLLAYFPEIAILETLFAKIYFVFAFFAQISLFMLIGGLICALLASFCQWRWLNIGFAALFAAIVLVGVLGDALTYQLYHMHYGALAWRIYRAGAFSEVLPLGIKEHLLIIAAFLSFLALELIFAAWMWTVFSRARHKPLPRFVIATVICSWVIVYSVFALAVSHKLWSDKSRYAILRVGRIVPYLSQLYLASINNDVDRPLHYPRKPLSYSDTHKPLNIVIIAVDAWRYDTMNATVSPYIYQFAQQSTQFYQHYSSGNCTQAGLFGFFYGIPATYWQAFVDQGRGPVLIDMLQRQHYNLGFFFSATPKFPEFDKTIVAQADVLNWHTVGNSSMQRDARITENMLTFLKQQKTGQPFFAFLFYDSVHNYCEADRPVLNPFQPYPEHCNRFSLARDTDPAPYLNLYRNKVHYVDQQVHRVLQALTQQKRLDDTIVILTSDHGEQMNDEGMGLWGHASAYNDHQLHVPMIVHWPGHQPEIVRKRSTHYDVVPTLMKTALAVKNIVSDYSVGYSLFSSQQAPYFIAASYGDYAVIQLPRVLRMYPNGDYQLVDFYHRPWKAAGADLKIFKQANQQLQFFFK